MPWGAAAAAVVSYAASESASSSAQSAAESGQRRAEQLTLAQLEQQQKQYEELLALGQPYREAGGRGLARYEALTQDPSSIYEDPVYQSLLEQGTKAYEGSAAARGMQLSGRTLAGLQELGQTTASQYRSQIMGELANLANLGSTNIGQAYGVGGQAMQQTGQAYGNLANLAQQTGQIGAATALGQSSAITNLAGQLGSAYIKSN